MADFEQAGATERLRRVAILRDMQRRLRHSAAEALGVPADANAVVIRSAFMRLTKEYHPAKFARLDEATVKLANEVFLALREAYEALREKAAPGRAASSPPVRLATEPGATAPGAKSSIEPARSTLRAVAASAAAPPAAPAERTAILPPSSARPAPAERTPILPSAKASPAPAERTPIPPSSARPAISAASSVPASTSPAGRAVATASPAKPVAPLTVRFGGAPASTSGREPSAPGGDPTGSADGAGARSPRGIAGREPSVPGGEPTGSADGAGARSLRGIAGLSKVRELLSKKRWTEAKAVLEALSSNAPLERRYLAWIAYARAVEALDAGRLAEARRELVRATAIDPALEPAKIALAEITNPVASRR
jgi:hypothetical protein